MNMSEKINIGDIVKVHFQTDVGMRSITGEVLYIPQATGDSWTIKAENNTINYIQTYTVMTKKTWTERAKLKSAPSLEQGSVSNRVNEQRRKLDG